MDASEALPGGLSGEDLQRDPWGAVCQLMAHFSKRADLPPPVDDFWTTVADIPLQDADDPPPALLAALASLSDKMLVGIRSLAIRLNNIAADLPERFRSPVQETLFELRTLIAREMSSRDEPPTEPAGSP